MIKYFYKKFVRIFVLDRLLNKNHENLEKIVQERIFFIRENVGFSWCGDTFFINALFIYIYSKKNSIL